MSLNGSLDGFALPDVLVLLSTTKKTGELRVWGERTEGSVWLDAGQVVAASTSETEEPVEAVTDLLRLRGGGFSFEIRDPSGKGSPLAMEAVLGEAHSLLDEWRKIEEVVPSGDASVRLVDEPPTSQVTVEAGQWKVLLHLAAAPGSTVNQLRSQLELSELMCARAVKELVEAGLARVGDDSPAATTPNGDDLERVWATARRLSGSDGEGAGAARAAGNGAGDANAAFDLPAEASPAPASAPVAATPAPAGEPEGEAKPAEPINRDVLLKFISSSRG